MKYKTEVMVNGRVVKSNLYLNLTDPKQAVNKTVRQNKNKYSHFLIVVANDSGVVWSFVSIKKLDRVEVRPMKKYGLVMNRDDIDMVFTGNKKITEVVSL